MESFPAPGLAVPNPREVPGETAWRRGPDGLTCGSRATLGLRAVAVRSPQLTGIFPANSLRRPDSVRSSRMSARKNWTLLPSGVPAEADPDKLADKPDLGASPQESRGCPVPVCAVDTAVLSDEHAFPREVAGAGPVHGMLKVNRHVLLCEEARVLEGDVSFGGAPAGPIGNISASK